MIWFIYTAFLPKQFHTSAWSWQHHFQKNELRSSNDSSKQKYWYNKKHHMDFIIKKVIWNLVDVSIYLSDFENCIFYILIMDLKKWGFVCVLLKYKLMLAFSKSDIKIICYIFLRWHQVLICSNVKKAKIEAIIDSNIVAGQVI